MPITTFTLKDKSEVENNLKAYNLSLHILEGLKSRGFKTINEAFKSVVNKSLTIRELDKFAKLLHADATYRKDSHSWEWFKNWGGQREVTFYLDNYKILVISINPDLTIERHYTGGSYNLVEHTINSLIDTCKESVKTCTDALKLYEEAETRIYKYEQAIRDAVTDAYNKYISDIDKLVYSKSY